MELKIQFIVTGWHYNQDTLIDGLIEHYNNYENVDVFYACHREPPQKIKDNLKWKLFPNLGMGDGGFQQAIDHLSIEDNTVCFFMQDDLIIKSWDFIDQCIERLNGGYKFIGNCQNYPVVLNPDKRLEKYDLTFKDFAKEESRHLYTDQLPCLTIRGSFICCQYKTVRVMFGFEPIFHIPEIIQPIQKEDGTYATNKEKGIGGIGNLILDLFSYKINKVWGHEAITYLSRKYLDSPYIYECARGQIDPNNPPQL